MGKLKKNIYPCLDKSLVAFPPSPRLLPCRGPDSDRRRRPPWRVGDLDRGVRFVCFDESLRSRPRFGVRNESWRGDRDRLRSPLRRIDRDRLGLDRSECEFLVISTVGSLAFLGIL